MPATDASKRANKTTKGKKKTAQGSLRLKKEKKNKEEGADGKKSKANQSMRKKKEPSKPSEASTRKKKDKKKTELDDADDDEKMGGDADMLTPPKWMTGCSKEQNAAYDAFAKRVFGLGVDGLLKEYSEDLKPYLGSPIAKTIFDANATKNRYKDVVCNDHTRVVIADGKQPDYIHANYVKGEPLFNQFICTQGPMTTTKEEFWRMIMHLKCHHTIMLCETTECGKVKCEQYWPAAAGEKMVFGDITVEHISQNNKDTSVVMTLLQLTMGSEQHKMRHHHWKTWPDRSVPKSSRAGLRILRCVRYSKTPIVVHCSAGVGRTGTLVALEMCLQSILGTCKLDLIAICKRLRDQRLHVLQVDMQYVYLAQAVLEYGRAIGYIKNAETIEQINKFKAALDAVVATRDDAGRPIQPAEAKNSAENPAASAT